MNKKIIAIAFVVLGVICYAVTINVQAPASRPEPYLKYRFLVEIDGITQASFQEVEGLNVTVDVVEYREGGDSTAPKLMPGLPHYGPLILRDGVTASNELLEWMQETVDGTMWRRSISVIILGPDGNEAARYNMWSAWPSRWSLGRLDSLGVGPVIEELVIQYEGFERETSTVG